MDPEYNENARGWVYALDDKRSISQRVEDALAGAWDKFQWHYFWSYADETRGLQMWRAVIDGTQMLETNSSYLSVQSFVNTNFVRLGFDSVKNNPLANISQNAYGQLAAIRKGVGAEVAWNIVVTAIALKRFQFRHHNLPAKLDELVPEFLKSVPTDYMDGQPLHYRLKADGTFLLYSVGENGKDDSGNPSFEA